MPCCPPAAPCAAPAASSATAHTEGKEIVSGYMIVSANSLDKAVEMAQGCPICDTGGSVEVRPVQVFA